MLIHYTRSKTETLDEASIRILDSGEMRRLREKAQSYPLIEPQGEHTANNLVSLLYDNGHC